MNSVGAKTWGDDDAWAAYLSAAVERQWGSDSLKTVSATVVQSGRNLSLVFRRDMAWSEEPLFHDAEFLRGG